MVEAAAAILLGHRSAQVADLAQLRASSRSKRPARSFSRTRKDLSVGELTRGVADQLLLVCELKVH